MAAKNLETVGGVAAAEDDAATGAAVARRRDKTKTTGQNPAAEAAAPGKPVLTPAAAPAESPAAPAPPTTGAEVSQEYDEEGVESESQRIGR